MILFEFALGQKKLANYSSRRNRAVSVFEPCSSNLDIFENRVDFDYLIREREASRCGIRFSIKF